MNEQIYKSNFNELMINWIFFHLLESLLQTLGLLIT